MANQYWKHCEYRVRNIFRKHGWRAERVPCSGSAAGFKGDVVADKDGVFIAADHKSTRGKESITIKRQDLLDIKEIAENNTKTHWFVNHPVLTFNYLQDRQVYAIVPLEELIRLYERRFE